MIRITANDIYCILHLSIQLACAQRKAQLTVCHGCFNYTVSIYDFPALNKEG
jgi:hypothetical protein